MLKPRDYQIEASDKAVDCLIENKNDLFVLPVGSGKSLIFSEISKKLKKPLLIIAHNQDLVLQNYEAALNMGVKGSIYCSGLGVKKISNITFCTVKSAKNNTDLFKHFDYAVIDEADYKFTIDEGGEYHKFFQNIGLKSFVGFTGSPITTVSYSMGTMIKVITRMRPKNFNNIAYHLPVKYMVDNKYWSELSYKAYIFEENNLKLNSTGKDYTDVSIEKALKQNNVNNNVYLDVKSRLKNGDSHILLFARNLEDAEVFKNNLEDSEVISYKTKKNDRQRIIKEFKEGRIRVLINLAVLQAGFNCPELKTVILASPYGSIRSYVQIVGRVVRKHGDKTGEVVDYCGNVLRYGRIEDIDLKMEANGNYQFYSGNTLISGVFRDEIGKIGSTTDKEQEERLKSKENRNVGHLIMKWGKYKGKPLSEIRKSYLIWCLENLDDKYLGDIKQFMSRK